MIAYSLPSRGWKICCCDRFHQIRYLIRSFNDATSKTFDIGTTAAFDEGNISTRSRVLCVKQYNKYKPEKFRIELFVLSYITHNFVRHVDLYQGNNAGNIDIHAISANQQTSIKAVVNGIIVASVGNDTDGSRKLFWIIFMHAPRYWSYCRRSSLCLHTKHVIITGNSSQ